MNENRPKILLHVCCAVCMAYPIELLKENYEPIVFFCNPNIYPIEEYQRRLIELINYCEQKGYKYIVDEYLPDNWYKHINGYESEPEKGERCNKCFEFRLYQTAIKAKELGISNFTTTLSVSPHKISKNIFQQGEKIAKEYCLKFLAIDFKKQNGFLKTMNLAKENNFYRQQYCGCEYSIRN